MNLALRLFDPHYDGRSIYPRLIVFPMADEDGGWGAAQAQIVIKPIAGRFPRFRTDRWLYTEVNLVATVQERGSGKLRMPLD